MFIMRLLNSHFEELSVRKITTKTMPVVAISVLLAIIFCAGIACGPTLPEIEAPVMASKFGTPLGEIGTLPAQVKFVTKGEMQNTFIKAYDSTLYDHFQVIDKEQNPCHQDKWYTACVEKNKIIVTQNESKEVVKTVELGDPTYIGDFSLGYEFFTVVLAKTNLTVMFYKTVSDEEGGSAQRKIVKQDFDLSALELADKDLTAAIVTQTVPGFAIWIATVKSGNVDTPLYELNFVGEGEKEAFVKRLKIDAPVVP